MYFYVYKLTDENGYFYIGSRGSEVEPSKDSYKGSMRSWNPDKNLLTKEIIKEFDTRENAYLFESSMIKEFINDPLNKNFNVPHEKWTTHGFKKVKDGKGGMMMVKKTDPKFINNEYEKCNRKGATTGKVWVFLGSTDKCIDSKDLQTYLDEGWIRGRNTILRMKTSSTQKGISKSVKGTVYVNNGKVTKRVHPYKLSELFENGWKKGKLIE